MREPGPLGEELQQVELLRGELDGRVVDADLPSAGVDRDPPGLHDLRAGGAVRATQHRLHAGDQLRGGEGLRQVVVGAELEAEDPVDLAVAGGEEDDRHLGGLADLLADLEAVDIGEADVEHDEAGPVAAERVEPGAARRRLQDPVPLPFQVQADEVGDVVLVVDDDDRPLLHLDHSGPHAPRERRPSP